MHFFRHQREPDEPPGCPKALWVFCKQNQAWQNSFESPITLTLPHECAGEYWLRFHTVLMTFCIIEYLLYLTIVYVTFFEKDKMYIITVVYETLNGIRERQFSCPVVSPLAGRGRYYVYTFLKGYSVHQRAFSLWTYSYFKCVADICHAVPQSATFLGNSISPADTDAYPSHTASPWAAASTSTPLPATTPWMVSCSLYPHWHFHAT